MTPTFTLPPPASMPTSSTRLSEWGSRPLAFAEFFNAEIRPFQISDPFHGSAQT